MSGGLVQRLHHEFGLSHAQIMRLIARSPHTYKIYQIPKMTGGTRTIAQPAKETKAIQNWLIQNVFRLLPVHSCAMAYKTGASIKKNADAHSKNSYLSKFDFMNFFTSIKSSDLHEHLACHLSNIFSIEDLAYIARVSCIRLKVGGELCLSIGAPSSPILSNSLMYGFDEQVDSWCRSRGIVYTRYADDLTFSSNTAGIASEIEPAIRNIIRGLAYPRLWVNNKKTIHLSMKGQRRVTGIIINNDGQLSLGRAKKRLISALIHRFSINELPPSEQPKLQGLLGFAIDVEPTFFQSMKLKYGASTIEAIMQIRK